MSAAPFMQLYVADYLADTQHLTAEQHGAYLLMLMSMWRTKDGTLPNDAKVLAKVAHTTPSRWAKISPTLMQFFTEEGGRLFQKRLAKEHQKAIHKTHSLKSNGALGGTAKALKDKERVLAEAIDLLQHSQISDIIKKEEPPSSTPLPVSASPQAARRDKGSSLPKDWKLPKSWGEWALSEYPTVLSRNNVVDIANEFRDYWVAVPGQRGRKSDWEATWRNRVRDKVARMKRGPSLQKPTMVGVLDNLISDMEQAENVQFNEGGIGFAQNAGYLAAPKR